MFFDLHRCPDGWDFVGDEYIGHYPRIVGEGNDNEVGEQLEQMVHKHKHISSQIDDYSSNISKHTRHNPSGLSSSVSLTIGTYRGIAGGGRLTYTGDGMNGKDLEILTCPNRDEGNKICKETYSPNMPLVGNENRPNSVKWLACRRTNN